MLNDLKEARMKIAAAILLALAVFSPGANADCVKDQYGKVVCGNGQCETDSYRKVYCAKVGGGAVKDKYGSVKCGVGNCARDSYLEVWCSTEPGGGAAVDLYGKVKCLGGCTEGSADLCEEGK
jgi:hypothetical protein